jgi:hypothetical protein
MGPELLTAAAGAVGKELGKELGKEMGKHIIDVISFFRRDAKSTLSDLKRVHKRLEKFSIGKAAGGTELGEMPETANQSGPWNYQRGGLNDLFEEFFRSSVLGRNAQGTAAAAVADWKTIKPAAPTHYWRGRGQDFHLAHKDTSPSSEGIQR